MDEVKVIEIKAIGLDELVQKFSDLNNELLAQKTHLKELKTAKEKDTQAIIDQTAAIIKQKAEIQVVGREIKSEILNREKLAKQVDNETDTKLKSLDKQIKLAQRQQVQNAQAQSVIEKNSQAETLASQKAEQQAARKIGYINELKIEVGQLEQKYFALSKAELEGSLGKTTLDALTNKRAELSKLQQAYGNYGLQVGNYGSATKMLGINLGQVMKEMPNFAISARIGIMSLTNNLPMLAESIKAVKLEQIAMRKSQEAMTAAQIAALPNMGKIPSMFKMITASIFGLTGVMSILMVLFQIFGADALKWIGSLFKGGEAARSFTRELYDLQTAQTMINKTMKDGGGVYADAVKSIEQMSVELEAAKGNHEEEKIALDKYNSSLGVNFGIATDVAGAIQRINDKKDAYIEAMMKMAFANAFMAKSGEDMVAIIDIQTKSQGQLVREAGGDYKSLIESVERWDKTIKNITESQALTEEQRERQLKMANNNRYIAALKITSFEINEREKQLEIVKKHQGEMSEAYKKYYKEYLDMLESAGIKSAGIQGNHNQKKLDDQVEFLKYYSQVTLEELDKLDKAIVKQETEAEKERYAALRADVESELGTNTPSNNDEQKTLNDQAKERYQNLKNQFADEAVLRGGQFELQKEMLDQQMRDELSSTQLTEEQKTLIKKRYAAEQNEIELAKVDYALRVGAQLANAVAEFAGKESKIGKAAAVAGITINAIQGGIAAVTKGVEQLGPVAGAIVGGAEALAIGVSAAAAIKEVYAVQSPGDEGGSNVTKTTVTEKFSTGGKERPDSPQQADDLLRLTQRAERILTIPQTNAFEGIIRAMRNYGGSGSITSNVGVNSSGQAEMIASVVRAVMQSQKPPVMVWKDKLDFEDKMARMSQNTQL